MSAKSGTLETIWEVDDALWAIIEPRSVKKVDRTATGDSRRGYRPTTDGGFGR